MDGEEKAWTIIIGLIVILLLGLMFSISDYSKDYNAKVVEMVKAGADPIAIQCALRTSHNTQAKCIILATKK